jgi:hypothetical protein
MIIIIIIILGRDFKGLFGKFDFEGPSFLKKLLEVFRRANSRSDDEPCGGYMHFIIKARMREISQFESL